MEIKIEALQTIEELFLDDDTNLYLDLFDYVLVEIGSGETIADIVLNDDKYKVTILN